MVPMLLVILVILEEYCYENVILICQGRGVGNGKKKMEAAAAAQEDRDKPYACDSEF